MATIDNPEGKLEKMSDEALKNLLFDKNDGEKLSLDEVWEGFSAEDRTADNEKRIQALCEELCRLGVYSQDGEGYVLTQAVKDFTGASIGDPDLKAILEHFTSDETRLRLERESIVKDIRNTVLALLLCEPSGESDVDLERNIANVSKSKGVDLTKEEVTKMVTSLQVDDSVLLEDKKYYAYRFAPSVLKRKREEAMVADLRTAIDNLPVEGMSVTDFEAFVIPANAVYQRPSNDERRQLIESAITNNAVIFEGERFYQPGTEPSSPTQPDEVRKKFLVSQGKKFNVAVDSLRQAFTAGDAENELSQQTISRIGPALQMARESLSAMRKHPEFAADAKIEKVAKMLEYADYQDRFLGDFYGRPKTDKERADFRGRRELLVAGLEKVSDYTRDIFEVSFDIPVTDKQEPIIEPIKARAAVSFERFADGAYHRFGDFEKEGYAGVFYNFKSNDDAFVVDGKAIAVADGMGSCSQSGTLSRLMAKKLAEAANKATTDEEFRQIFSRASLNKLMDRKEYDAALDELFKGIDPKSSRHYKAARRDNASQTNSEPESYTTFSVLRDSDDGKQIYCAMLGDSPVIIIDRNDAGEITGWQYLNKEVLIKDTAGIGRPIPVTNKNYSLDEIEEELRKHETSGVGFNGLGEPEIPRDTESDLRFVKINKQPNRVVVIATDALTKLLYRLPKLEIAELEKLVAFSETDLLVYLKQNLNNRFANIYNADGSLNRIQLTAALNLCRSRIDLLTEEVKSSEILWDPDGSLNILNVLKADPKALQMANDDFTFVTVAAGEQVVNPGTQRATSTPPPVGGTGTAGSSVDNTTDAVAVKSAELTAAGNDLGDAYMQVSQVMRQLQSGRPVSPDDWKNAKQGLQTFLKSAAAMVAGGLKLSGDAQDAQTYLSGLNRLEDSAEIKRAMDAIEMELRTQYLKATVGATPDTIAAKRAALTAAGNDLGDAYDMVDEVMQRLQSGRPVPADERKEARKNLLMFLDSAAAMVAGGLTLSPDAQAAQSYLDGLDRLDDWAEIRRAMDAIEVELRTQYWETGSSRPDEKLERVATLRAQATITKSILDAYEKANGGALSPIADLLVRRVVREVLERSEKDTVSSDPSFIRFLNQIRESTKNGNLLSILDADSGQRESITLKYVIERLVGGLNESIKKLYKERSDKLSAEGRDEDIFNREEIDTYDSFLAVGKWLAELKDEKNIDPKLRSQLVTELEKTERNLAEKLEKLRGQRYPSVTPSIGRAPAEPTSFSASFDLGGKKALGGMTSSVGIDATAAGAFAAMKPEVRKPRQNTAIDFKFKNGKYTLPMAEAFANDVFYDFFKKFDEQRNPGEEFDAADESHHERYEKAVEGYRLWLEALGVFTKQAKEIIQQDLGIKADPADFVAFEDELEQLVIEDTQKVRGMIDKISEYNNLEEDEARKENELIDLGGFEKLKIQVDELQLLRQEKKFEADALIARLTNFAKSRSPYSRAREFRNRTIWQKAKVPQNEGFWAKLARKASDATGTLMWKFKGLFTFKEARNLEKELQKTYGMDIETAADYFPEIAKHEERLQAQTEAAIREYERIEKMYHELKSKVATVERAQQEKDLISNRFNQLRLGIFSNTQAFKTVARLTAGRSRDIIKGMLDGAASSDEKLGEAVKKSEVQLEGLRRAANFKFGGDRYADIPEIAETLGAEGSVIAEADSVITEAVKKRIQKVVEQTTTVNNQGTLLIRKAFLAYGKRGYEIGEQVLSESIKKAKDENNGRRANQLQALLFELRALKG